MQVWNLLHVARLKHTMQKIAICQAISSQLRHVSTIRKNLLSSSMSSTCPHNMNFSPLAAEIGLPVWGTPTNFNGFRILAALLHGSQVVSISQTLWRWTEGATYVLQGSHHVGHWPAFLVVSWTTMKGVLLLDPPAYLCDLFPSSHFCCCDSLWPPTSLTYFSVSS